MEDSQILEGILESTPNEFQYGSHDGFLENFGGTRERYFGGSPKGAPGGILEEFWKILLERICVGTFEEKKFLAKTKSISGGFAS